MLAQAILPIAGHAQASDRSVGCLACEVKLERIAILVGAPDSLGGLTDSPALQRDSKGRYYLVNDIVPSVIQVFGSDGKYLRSIGATGSGPGEYRFIRTFVVGPGDSIHIFDPMNARYTVLDSAFAVVRESRSLFPTRAALLLKPGRVVVNAVVPRGTSSGLPLHELGVDGSVIRSFGDELRQSGPGLNGIRMNRILAKDPAGLLWSAHVSAYQIDAYSESGARVRQIKRAEEWFQPYDDLSGFDPNTAPPPMIVGMAVSETELWVLIQVPVEDWRRHLVHAPSKVRGSVLKPDRADTFFETLVEVLDPATGEVLVSQRVPKYLRGFLGRGRVFSFEADGLGVGGFTVWRIAVAR